MQLTSTLVLIRWSFMLIIASLVFSKSSVEEFGVLAIDSISILIFLGNDPVLFILVSLLMYLKIDVC